MNAYNTRSISQDIIITLGWKINLVNKTDKEYHKQIITYPPRSKRNHKTQKTE